MANFINQIFESSYTPGGLADHLYETYYGQPLAQEEYTQGLLDYLPNARIQFFRPSPSGTRQNASRATPK